MDYKIAVIGLGYVGLPLAIEFGKKYKVLGFDINKARVDELCQGRDHTMEADLEGMKQAVGLRAADAERGLAFSCDEQDLKEYNTYIVTVPTPIDRFNMPDLRPLIDLQLHDNVKACYVDEYLKNHYVRNQGPAIRSQRLCFHLLEQYSTPDSSAGMPEIFIS